MKDSQPLPDDARAAQVQTLVDLLEYRAAGKPADVVFRFLNGDGSEDGSLTFAQLQRRARSIAAHLGERVVPGERVVLLVPPGLEYVAAFFGCLYAGVVAVPAYPPNPRRADPRVGRIIADCGARVALVSEAFMARLDGWLALTPELSAITWLDAGHRATEAGDTWRAPNITGASLAMLQYTSGSTGDPRGVMLTHANLLHNSALIHRVSAHRLRDNGVFWLPPFHDMGLIGGILQPVYAGLSAALMAPATFLQRPLRWLEAMSRYHATTSGAPNFAYDLCVERIPHAERAALDLSAWRTSFNGAEPIRADSIARFTQAFAESGLRRDVILPCYGLAEATLLVSGGPAQQAPSVVLADRRGLESGELRVVPDGGAASSAALVASGHPVEELVVEIVDPDTQARSEPGQIGEIWVAGSSVARGYWNKPEASGATFRARLAGSDRSFLRTGDLGVLVDGELVVTGRLKDLVILEGRNYYPHDIEVAAERSHANLRAGYTAAFGVAGDTRERLVLVAEVARQHKPDADAVLFQAIRTELANTVGVMAEEIVLIRQNTIPRTSSGKIQRRACRAAYLEGSLDVLGRWRQRGSDVVPAHDAISAFVLDWVREELSVDPMLLDPRTSIRDLGLDSLAATRLVVALEGRFGRRIDPARLWEEPDIGSLARYLASLDGRDATGHQTARSERKDYGPPSPATTDVAQWGEYRSLRARLDTLAEHGIASPFFTVHDGVTGSAAVIDGRRVVNFANYNYLGLSGDPDVTRAAQEAAERWGTSVSASRVVSGERPVHRELEREIARFLGTDDAVVYVGGVPANVSTISHLLGPEDIILCDALVHNSAMQGAEFSGARRLVFPHNDWDALDRTLARVRSKHRRALVVIEGVYSADGDVPDLRRFVEVKERHHAMLMVDEAHSLGTIGATGRGIAEHAGVDRARVEIWMGTLSKSLASCGGYIAGSSALVEYLKYTSPGFVYSVGIPPSNAAAALAALRKLDAEPERVQRLQARARTFLALCRAAGLDSGASADTPVVPVMVGSSLRAARLSELLLDAGVNVQPMVAPSVPEGQARLRFFIASTHSEAELRAAVRAVTETLELMGQDEARAVQGAVPA